MQEAILVVKRVVEIDKDFGNAQEVVEGVISGVGVEMLNLLASDVDEKENKKRMGMIWRWDIEDMELLLALRAVLQVKIDVAMIMVRERKAREGEERKREEREEKEREERKEGEQLLAGGNQFSE
jgi:hypothetical protein